MKTIPFTQFLAPDGRTRQIEIDVDDETFVKYHQVTELGLRMTVELLST